MLKSRSSAPFAFAALAAIAGCDGGESTPRELAPGIDAIRPVLTAAPDLLPAADPRLDGFAGWPIAFDVVGHDPMRDTCAIELARDGTVVREIEASLEGRKCAATWDGLDRAGAELRPGPIDATAVLMGADGLERARGTTGIEVVRLGVQRVQLTGERVSLLYRETAGFTDGWYEIETTRVPWQMAPDRAETGGAPLEIPTGAARTAPPPHDDLLSPPLDPRSTDGVEHDTFSLPTGWVAGSEMSVVATLSSAYVGTPGSRDPQRAEIRVVAPEGLSIAGDDRFGDGRHVTATTNGSLVPAVDRYDASLRWRFEARRAGGEWQPVPGAFVTTHRLYGFVRQPIFDSTSVPYRAWVDVVDQIADWVDGVSAEESEVLAALVAGVYWETGLRYDTARAASYYTDYTSGFSGATFFMQAFQRRSLGTVVNCSDAASILSAYANMIGIDARYHILTNRAGINFRFDLNYIQAIGVTGFDDTPFDSGRGAFRYHAIVGTRDGQTWDATLAVDGDGAPAAPPHVLKLVQNMEPTLYLQDLSSQWDQIQTDLDEKVRIR